MGAVSTTIPPHPMDRSAFRHFSFIAVMLALLFAAAIVETIRLTSLSAITNGDIWWHLSSGLWILQNHSLPHNGIFSQSATQSWTAVSWGYDVLLAALYRAIDLRAVPALLMCLKAGLAVITFLLAGGMRGKFWTAVILSGIAQYVLGAMQPSPAYFSLLFFGIELLLVFASRERPQILYWLAPLLLIWANLDDQFVYGIGLIILFLLVCGAGALDSNSRARGRALPRSSAALAAAAVAIVASPITPSFYRPYAVFFLSIAGPATAYLPDFKAMTFHQPQDYVLLLLTMAAFLALGRRHSKDWFQIAILCASAMLSFYAQRNIWMVTLVAVAVIGRAGLTPGSQVSDLMPQKKQASDLRAGLIAVGVAACALLAMIAWGLPRHRDVLLAKIAEGYPVSASNYIREHHLPQPLFNAYEWGGFLTWYLPQYPVAIDSRTDLYGDDFIILYSKAMNADVRYTAFPPMAEARTLVFPKTSVMGEALSTAAGFKVAYSDDVGLVLTREDDAVASK